VKIRNWELWRDYSATSEKIWRNHYLAKKGVALVELIVQKPGGVTTWYVYLTWKIPNPKYMPPFSGSNDSFHDLAKFQTQEKAEAYAVKWMREHPRAGIR
jgi:hypothetical protein